MEDLQMKGKFWKVVCILATGTEPLQARLADAYVNELIHIKPSWLPPEHVESLRAIRHGLTSHTAVGNEGTVMATCRQMNDSEASQWANKMVDLCGEMIL